MFETIAAQAAAQAAQKTIEKSFTDKTTAKEEIERIREIMRAENLTRTHLKELRNLLVGINIKLVNFDDHDRTTIGHLLTHIENLFQAEEELYEYVEKSKMRNASTEAIQLLMNGRKKIEHNLKIMTDVYLYCVNSSLSVTAVGFQSYTQNKFEFTYPTANPPTIQNTAQK